MMKSKIDKSEFGPDIGHAVCLLRKSDALRYKYILLIHQSSTLCNWLSEKYKISISNVNLELSSQLYLKIPKRKIALKAGRILEGILLNFPNDAVILDHIEILFDPLLGIDVLKWIEKLSRKHILIINWPGEYKNQELSYASPPHIEYKTYTDIKGIIIDPQGMMNEILRVDSI